ncbi:MAG TPA: DNA-binding response regulator [Bacteroidales bacterium]|nr:MAG: Response regulator [candidate division TM6 bacterium GW2011_GWF2_33_332]HBS89131.1 DNA-binding response regulator [Bacteroidales bacterium]
MKIKAIIIDDEPEGIRAITNISKKYCDSIEIVGSATNIDDAVNLIKMKQPDLVFLDIILEPTNESGFDLFSRFSNYDFEVIFTTAHNDFAIKAIKYSALDYLEKPISLDDFKEAISKMIKKKNLLLNQKKLELLLENIKSNTGDFSKIALPSMNGYDFINVNDIIKCKADGSYTNIYFLNGKEMFVSKSLKEIEELLPENKFFRIHKSVTINLNYISKYISKEGNMVQLIDGSIESIAIRNKQEFFAIVNIFNKQK